jgi:hypothetical protein
MTTCPKAVQGIKDSSAFYSLSDVFREMVQDPKLTVAYLVVDALEWDCHSFWFSLLGQC